jgi:hypothetical protein
MSCLGNFTTNELLFCQMKNGYIWVVCERCAARVGQDPLSFNPELLIIGDWFQPQNPESQYSHYSRVNMASMV